MKIFDAIKPDRKYDIGDPIKFKGIRCIVRGAHWSFSQDAVVYEVISVNENYEIEENATCRKNVPEGSLTSYPTKAKINSDYNRAMKGV